MAAQLVEFPLGIARIVVGDGGGGDGGGGGIMYPQPYSTAWVPTQPPRAGAAAAAATGGKWGDTGGDEDGHSGVVGVTRGVFVDTPGAGVAAAAAAAAADDDAVAADDASADAVATADAAAAGDDSGVTAAAPAVAADGADGERAAAAGEQQKAAESGGATDGISAPGAAVPAPADALKDGRSASEQPSPLENETLTAAPTVGLSSPECGRTAPAIPRSGVAAESVEIPSASQTDEPLEGASTLRVATPSISQAGESLGSPLDETVAEASSPGSVVAASVGGGGEGSSAGGAVKTKKKKITVPTRFGGRTRTP